MAKSPRKSRRRTPRKPTRAKAARPDAPPTPEALADLLNPAINKGTAGLGSGTGKNEPDAAAGYVVGAAQGFLRRPHRAQVGAGRFLEAPQQNYSASPITGLDPALAKELGLGDEEDAASPSPRAGRGSAARRAVGPFGQ